MAFFYRKEEKEKAEAQLAMPDVEEERPFWQTSLQFFVLVGILVFATWGKPDSGSGLWTFIYEFKWHITGLFGIGLALSLIYILKIKYWYVMLGAIPIIILAFI